MALAQFHLILSQTKSWWEKKELNWAGDKVSAKYGFGEDQMKIILYIIWSLECTTVPKRYCSALLLKVLICVSTPFLYDKEIKMTLCMIYSRSLGCDAILFDGVLWVLYWNAEQKYCLIITARNSLKATPQLISGYSTHDSSGILQTDVNMFVNSSIL